MGTFLQFNRLRATLLTLVWGVALAGIGVALPHVGGSRRMTLWVALGCAGALFALGVWSLVKQRGRSGLTISPEGITRHLGPKGRFYPWERIDQVKVLDLGPGVSGIHLRLRGDATTKALGTAGLVGGTNRALNEIRTALAAHDHPPQVIDIRKSRG